MSSPARVSTVRKRTIGTNVKEWSTDRGRLRTERHGREVLLFRASGHLETELVELFQEVVDDALVVGRPHLFWDGEDLTGYDSEFRLRLGKYCVAVRDRVGSMHVYTPHRFVAMGAAVINVWLGGFFQMKKTREELMAALEAQRTKWPAS